MAGKDVAGDGQDTAPAKQRLSWSEKRERRRRNRRRFEEILAWILVPALFYVGYLIFQAVGGVPREIQDFALEVFNTLTSGRL